MPLFSLKGFIREPKPPKKGVRALLGILASVVWGTALFILEDLGGGAWGRRVFGLGLGTLNPKP